MIKANPVKTEIARIQAEAKERDENDPRTERQKNRDMVLQVHEFNRENEDGHYD